MPPRKGINLSLQQSINHSLWVFTCIELCWVKICSTLVFSTQIDPREYRCNCWPNLNLNIQFDTLSHYQLMPYRHKNFTTYTSHPRLNPIKIIMDINHIFYANLWTWKTACFPTADWLQIWVPKFGDNIKTKHSQWKRKSRPLPIMSWTGTVNIGQHLALYGTAGLDCPLK